MHRKLRQQIGKRIERLEPRHLLAAGDILVQMTQPGIDFGADVDVYDDLLVVGAPSDDTLGTNAGRVFVYRLDGTADPPLVRTIENPLPAATNFGRKLDLHGSRLIVSATDKAFLFDLDDAGFEIRLDDPTNTNDHDFGSDVAVSDDYYVVANKFTGFFTSGNDEVYAYDVPTRDRTLLSSTNSLGLHSVSVHDATVAIGFSASVEIYDAVASNPIDSVAISQNSFGRTYTALQDTRLIAGATHVGNAEISGQPAGAAFLFEIGQDDPIQTWSNPDPVGMGGFGGTSEEFGAAVALDGRIAAAGEPQGESEAAGLYDSPTVSIFDTVTGDELINVVAPGAPLANTSPNYHFGRSIGVSGQFVAVGADSAVFVLDSGLAAFNQPPALTRISGNAAYTEDSSGVAIAPQALVTDADSVNFATGKLTAKVAANATSDDRLSVRHAGNSAGQIGVSGNTITYGGVAIGTFTGGTGSTPLVVALNGNSTLAATQALVRSIRFRTLGNAPSTAARSVTLQVTDGDGAASALKTITVSVTALNDAPILDNAFDPKLRSIPEDSTNPGGTQVTSLLVGAFSDPDGTTARGIGVISASGFNGTWQYSLNGGTTWVNMGSPSSTAALLIPGYGRVRFVPKTDFNGTVKLFYRAWDQTKGSQGGSLTTGGNTDGPHTFSTASESASVTVTPVNDVPKIVLSGTINYVHDKPAIVVAPSAAVTDIDSNNFAGGRLRVRITDGSSSSNRLAVGGGFTVDANNNVLQGATIIGKRVSNGFGTKELVVTFNTKATKSVVQELARAITFKTAGGAAGQRKVVYTVSDGNGGLSAEASKVVNVT